MTMNGAEKKGLFFLFCLCDPGPEYHTLFAFLIFNFLQCSLYAWHLVVSVGGGGGKETNEKNRNFAGLRKERRRTASPFCCVCSVSPFNKKKKKIH